MKNGLIKNPTVELVDGQVPRFNFKLVCPVHGEEAECRAVKFGGMHVTASPYIHAEFEVHFMCGCDLIICVTKKEERDAWSISEFCMTVGGTSLEEMECLFAKKESVGMKRPWR